MDISLKEIKCLLKIIENGSFSDAADEMGLAQPTLSSHIANLEKKLSTKLLKRNRNGIIPAEAGKIVYSYGIKINKNIEYLQRDIKRLLGVETGTLTIGGSTIPGTYILPAIISDFCSKYPGINLRLKITDTEKTLKALSEDKIDMGIVGYPPGKTFYSKQICTDTIIIAVNKNHRWASKKSISLNTLRSEPLIMREPGSATRKVFLKKIREKTAANLKIKFIVETSAAMKETIMSGAGAGIISQIAVNKELKQGLLHRIKIDGISLKRPFFLALKNYPPDDSAALKKFIELFDIWKFCY